MRREISTNVGHPDWIAVLGVLFECASVRHVRVTLRCHESNCSRSDETINIRSYGSLNAIVIILSRKIDHRTAKSRLCSRCGEYNARSLTTILMRQASCSSELYLPARCYRPVERYIQRKMVWHARSVTA